MIKYTNMSNCSTISSLLLSDFWDDKDIFKSESSKSENSSSKYFALFKVVEHFFLLFFFEFKTLLKSLWGLTETFLISSESES